MKNSPDLVNDIDNNEENDLHLDFKRVAKNSPLNTKYTFKRSYCSSRKSNEIFQSANISR